MATSFFQTTLRKMQRYKPVISRFLPGLFPKTLLGRSLLIIITPLIFLQVTSTWFFYETHWDTLTKRLTSSVAGDIGLVLYLMDQLPTSQLPEIFEATHSYTDITFIWQPGQSLPISPLFIRDNPVDRQLRQYLQDITEQPFLIDSRSLEKAVEIRLLLEKPAGVLQVFVPRRRLFSSTTYVFILWMVGSSMVLFMVATIFMGNQTKPVKKLAQVAEEFGKGRDVVDFKPEGASEVQQVGIAFRRMRERIQRQISQRTDMLAGVSHDLRTPLTRMRLQLALMAGSPQITALLQDMDEMSRMIDGYLAFARGEGTEVPRLINFSRLIESVAANARRQQASLLADIADNLVLPLRPDALRRCLTNLLENAQRYGNHIWLQAYQHRQLIHVIIDDDGPGIPKDQRQNVFKPFFRLQQTDPAGEPPHMGLGLTIARDIIRNHGGQLELHDSPHKGLRIHIRLPV